MGFHLTKCRKNHANEAFVVCPFNALHHIPKPEEQYHLSTCGDRKSVELQKYTEQEKPLLGSTLPNVTHNNTDIPNTENWELETVTGTYNPSAKAATMQVLRKIEGATPSQRKEFRINERDRLGKLSQGLSCDSFDLDQTQIIPGLSSQQSVDTGHGPSASIRRDSHTVPLRRPTIVQESAVPVEGNVSDLLRVHVGRGGDTAGSRNASHSGELRRPGHVQNRNMMGSNFSDDGASSTTSYTVNDTNTAHLLTMARGRGLQILKGIKKPGGMAGKE